MLEKYKRLDFYLEVVSKAMVKKKIFKQTRRHFPTQLSPFIFRLLQQ